MILKSSLRNIVLSQRSDLEKQDLGLEREIKSKIDLHSNFVVILTGIRRCGKSTLLRQLMKDVDNFYYFNFEDPRTINFEIKDFSKLDDIFHEEFGESHYYFFDEIQNLDQWERFVRFLQDQNKKVILTGSNASLLSKELGTKLTGRHLSYELFPFSYSEFLKFFSQEPSADTFSQYMELGGFPDFLKNQNKEILHQLFQDILLRDIVVRYHLRDYKIIQDLALFLLTNNSNLFTFNRLKNQFNLGSSNTAMNYVHFLENAYLIFSIPKFDFSFTKRRQFARKAYAIDSGMIKANSASFSEDYGRLLENIVFLHLRKSFKDIYFLRNKYECDFLVREGQKSKLAIQVVHTLDDDNLEREIKGLKEAMTLSKAEKGLILTFDQEDELEGFRVLPFWKWLVQ